MASYLVYHISKDLNVTTLESSYLISCLLTREDGLDKRGDFALEDGPADQALQRMITGVENNGWDEEEVHIPHRTKQGKAVTKLLSISLAPTNVRYVNVRCLAFPAKPRFLSRKMLGAGGLGLRSGQSQFFPIENTDVVYAEQMIGRVRSVGMREWRTTIVSAGLCAVFNFEATLQLSLSGSRG